MNKKNASEIEVGEIEDRQIRWLEETKLNVQRNVNCNKDEGIQIGEHCRRYM